VESAWPIGAGAAVGGRLGFLHSTAKHIARKLGLGDAEHMGYRYVTTVTEQRAQRFTPLPHDYAGAGASSSAVSGRAIDWRLCPSASTPRNTSGTSTTATKVWRLPPGMPHHGVIQTTPVVREVADTEAMVD
jgi:hypothetical protein